ncbi:MAG: hypothetical protein NC191_04800 [Muribaculaceae bacterium]|nr:hypothetical protein [Muribaculaceae bacterium]
MAKRYGFGENKVNEKSPLEELTEMLMLTDEEQENWRQIMCRYNLKFLSMTEKVA